MAVMMNPRETWTDQRLDAFEKKVDDGFAQVNQKVDDGFKAVDQRFSRLEGRFEKLENSYYALNRTLIGGFFVMIAALLGVIATQL